MAIARWDAPEIHERLLGLPLFQGMSRGDLESAMAQAKFTALTVAKGRTVAREDDACLEFYFLTRGTLSSTKRADDGGYHVTETVQAPDVLQPERIFGLTQRYTRTFRTVTECDLISLGKAEMLMLSDRFQIFRLNLLNMISTRSQRLVLLPWRTKPRTVRHKIVRFIEDRCARPAGEKTLGIKMERLAWEIGESRLNVSRELNAMDSEGLLSISRGCIHVPALERLIRQCRQ